MTTSAGRTSAGLTTLFVNQTNHMWAKIEISPGHPYGFMSIGHDLGGKTASLLAQADVPLTKSTTYDVTLSKVGTTLTFTVLTSTGHAATLDHAHAFLGGDRRARAGIVRRAPDEDAVGRRRRRHPLGVVLGHPVGREVSVIRRWASSSGVP